MTTRTAIVIPTLNEAAHLPRLLDSLARQTERPDELVVSDGGSTDETIAIAERTGAKVVSGERGRGVQIDRGIEATTAKIVLVLHADSQCDPKTIAAIHEHFRQHPDSPGGCLGHRFDGGSWLLRWVEWADRRRAKRGMSYGDQGQFFRRKALDQVGGFPRLPLMEDLEVSRRLMSIGRPPYLDVPLLCSTRGFERLGVIRTIWRNRRLRRTFLERGWEAAEKLREEYYSTSR